MFNTVDVCIHGQFRFQNIEFKSLEDVILDEPKSGEPTEPVIYEPEDKSHLTNWDRCKIWCCNAYHPYKKLPMLKWIQVMRHH